MTETQSIGKYCEDYRVFVFHTGRLRNVSATQNQIMYALASGLVVEAGLFYSVGGA